MIEKQTIENFAYKRQAGLAVDMKLKQLSHNGVLVSEYGPKGFRILFRGKSIALSPVQEEMAVAWVKKLGTEYVEDSIFVRNFFEDFRKALGIKEKASRTDFDFSEIERAVEKERAARLNMSKEQKKAIAAERKRQREANKEKYGYAVVDGERVELSNYVVEPSSIFMGRGKHPLRGRWKQGAKQADITLNISPDSKSKLPAGKWKEIIWEPEYMWIARWDDKLSGKKKYVWLSESSHIRQQKDIDKFNKARELEKKYGILKKHIIDNLAATDEKRRKVATVCYLIDALKIRVGDEKDEDEADTVGATTLTKKNIAIKSDRIAEFDFYGKDFVRLQKDVELPEQVVTNLRQFIAEAKDSGSPVFEGVRSENVSMFLDEVVPGISAKVFRTFHSTKAVNEFLEKADVGEDDAEPQKKHIAKMANLQAAIVCNHKRKIPKSWQASLERKKERLKAREARAKESLKKLEQKAGEAEQKYTAKLKAYEEKQNEKSKKLAKRLKAKHRQQMAKLKERIEKRRQSDKAYIEKARLQIKEQEATRDYNLGTSLKSYIDPRVYKRWADKVGCDWKGYYPATLQKKFSWVEKS